MQRRSSVAVVSASFGAGHDGAAAELAGRLRAQGHTVRRHDFVDLLPRRTGVLLRGLYRRQLTVAPRSWGWLLALAGADPLSGRAATLTAAADEATLAAIGPDTRLVVSTYPLASQVLGRLRRQGRLAVPVVTYLTDLSVHPMWIADGVDVHLALHDDTARQAKELGAPDVRVVAPAVRPAFRHPAAPAGRAAFGLPAHGPLALVVAGAWGVGQVERAALDIAATAAAVPVVACGRNDILRRRLNRSGRVLALGWVDDMPGLVRACQVVVQNAGGLSSLEALAAGVPVVTYRCLPGHGAANAEVLDRIRWVPWLRGRADLAEGLRAALAGGSAWTPAPLRPESVLADLAVAA
ncbi:glycosyltransferase [Dactylosporangium sp. AC04546]|uniref:MGDG synthase family glycosyltransferase n=1 Tax=Dactylosporangium sp. AC04546 TaxID=2862460 RepID=UPI001EDD0AE3|nr:glycosyltransferase [Dactylosporangium sp. AC04546]WVK88706.1 glycosyltransferase [Dactylosporangium sp. AC04546]